MAEYGGGGVFGQEHGFGSRGVFNFRAGGVGNDYQAVAVVRAEFGVSFLFTVMVLAMRVTQGK